MKKIVILLISIAVFVMSGLGILAEAKIIPDSAIRIRVIPNSDLDEDIAIKEEVKSILAEILYSKLLTATSIEDSRTIITNELDLIDERIDELFELKGYDKTFDVNFGLNYFPVKEFNGINYDEGYYESLVVSIGEAKGSNWWCVLFPPLCLVDDENRSEKEYKSLVKQMINKYLS